MQPKRRKAAKSSAAASRSQLNLSSFSDESTDVTSDEKESGVDWQKWTGRLSDAKTWTGDIKESFKDGSVSEYASQIRYCLTCSHSPQWKDPDSWRPKAKLTTGAGERDKVQTYSALPP